MPSTVPHETLASTRDVRQIIRRAGARMSGKAGRDRQVHRNSYDVNDPRAQVARRVADGTEAGTLAYIDAFIRTASEFDLFERNRGNGRPLRDSGIRILEVVLRNHWHDFRTGKIDPAISQIMKATGYVRGTVVKALERLRKYGFLDRVRRTEKVRHPIPGGPTRQQVNNLYSIDEGRLATAAGKNVYQRFLQLYRNAKLRLAVRAKNASVKAPPPPPPSPRTPAPGSELAKALAALGAAVDGSGPSLLNVLSPTSGV